MKILSSIFFFAVAMFFNANTALAESPIGLWWNDEKSAHIEVYENAGKLYGKIVWLKEPNDEAGKPKTDPLNSNPKLRTRPRLGMLIMAGVKPSGTDFWDGGELYNPKTGKTYTMNLTLQKDGTLKLRGYIGVSLIGKTTIWTRIK